MKLIFIVLLAGNIVFFGFGLLGSEPVARPKAAQQFGNLQTLEERDSKTKGGSKDARKKAPEMVSQSAADGSGRQCQLIGPFSELLHAEYLVERLGALDAPASIKYVEIADGKNYWVYSKPEMSEKEALRRLYEVQAKSIDSYIIPSGELANGISFGQFGDAKEAEKKAEQIRSQGYAAEVKEIPKSHSEIWVEINVEVAQKVSEHQWLELLKDEKSIEKRQNYCLGVAN